MNTYMQRIGMAVTSVLAAVSLWACVATREADGSIRIEFAPDMVINAFGLEDAMDGCEELLRDCLAGTFSRPCTAGERRDIRMVISNILETKRSLVVDPVRDVGVTG